MPLPLVHSELIITVLQKTAREALEINENFEKALDVGMGLMLEINVALGERHTPVVRALNHQYFRNTRGGAKGETP